MPNTNNKYNRQSIRLKGYDYSQNGMYFITICAQNRACLFGEIIDKINILNDAGQMVEKWYFELENKYKNAHCREYQVMPNHFHSIIEIINTDTERTDAQPATNAAENGGRPENEWYGMHNVKTNASIFDMMDWFKTMTTNEYIRGVKNTNWPRFNKRLWQLRYWDHIIRNENEYFRIATYIKNNPLNWENDSLNK